MNRSASVGFYRGSECASALAREAVEAVEADRREEVEAVEAGASHFPEVIAARRAKSSANVARCSSVGRRSRLAASADIISLTSA